MTYRFYAEAFLDECRERNLTEGTLMQYRANVNQFCAFLETKEASVTEESVLAYFSSIREKFNQTTIMQKTSTISHFLSYLTKLQVIPENPMRNINILQQKQKTQYKTVNMDAIAEVLRCAYVEKGLSKDEYNSYMYILRDIAVLELLFLTGMRVSELSQLTPDDVNLNAKTIHIRGDRSRERILKIDSEETLQALTDYWYACWQQIVTAKRFFINRQGSGLSIDSVRNMVKRYTKQAQLDRKFAAKVLWDSVDTFLAEEGADLLSLQQMPGHSCVNQIKKYVQQGKQSIETKHL